jgi:tetratricopeptide (TPR) repeat protein
MNSIWLRVFGLVLFLLTAAVLVAQRGAPKSGAMPNNMGADHFVVHGSVTLPDGVVPTRMVRLERVCGGRSLGLTFADSKGQYRFDLGILYTDSNPAAGGSSADTFADCSIRAALEGYHAETISLGPLVKKRNSSLPKLVLQVVGKDHDAIVSATDAGVSKNAKKEYDKALDLVAKMKFHEAIGGMEKAVSEDPKFATAWLSLGVLQMDQKDSEGAIGSYARAISADGKFAPPYIEEAVIESAADQWDKAIEHTNQAISLDPDSFPSAYYLNTMANIRLKKTDAALKSAAEGIRVDQDHLYPELQYMQGILLINKGDLQGGRTQLESYLTIAPNGDNAANARQQLTALSAAK